LLIIKKLGKSVKICYNYKNINKVLLKNQYLLPLIKEILNTVYNAKLSIKLNVIIAFNKIKIIPGYK